MSGIEDPAATTTDSSQQEEALSSSCPNNESIVTETDSSSSEIPGESNNKNMIAVQHVLPNEKVVDAATSSSSSSSCPAVPFSAINSNPQLVLGGNCSHVDDGEPHVPMVRFTSDRSVSWEDDQLVGFGGGGSGGGGGSRASRSGLSSPSIEPALSPPRSRSRSPLHIHFNDLAIETITEAAAQLRDAERAGHPRVVHFSAMKNVTVIHTEDAAADLFTPPVGLEISNSNATSRTTPPSSTTNKKSRFRHITAPPITTNIQSGTGSAHTSNTNQSGTADHPHETTVMSAVGRRSPPPEIYTGMDDDDETNDGAASDVVTMSASSPVVHAHAAATRLRDIVLEAEQQNNRMPIESVFRIFDHSGTGYISAIDFRMGLQELGGRYKDGQQQTEDAFDLINDEDCEELVALFDTNNDGLVSLLEFYRFMGRRSPPPLSPTNSSDDIDAELE